jgi:hypothetical protein
MRCLRWETQVSKTVALLLLLVCALALPSAALGVSPSSVKGSGVLQPGCPTDPLAADVYCPEVPIYFSIKADRNRRGTLAGGLKTRWMVPKRTSTTFSGRILCMSIVGNAMVVGGVLSAPGILGGVPFVEYAVDNGVTGDLVSDMGLFPPEDDDLALLPVGFPSICPAPGLLASIYGYLPLQLGGVVVKPPTP